MTKLIKHVFTVLASSSVVHVDSVKVNTVRPGLKRQGNFTLPEQNSTRVASPEEAENNDYTNFMPKYVPSSIPRGADDAQSTIVGYSQVQVNIYALDTDVFSKNVLGRFPHIGVRISDSRDGSSHEWQFGPKLQRSDGTVWEGGVFYQDMSTPPRRSIDIHSTGLSDAELQEIVQKIQSWPEYRGDHYHLLLNNCQDFAYSFLVQLKQAMTLKNKDPDVVDEAIAAVKKEKASTERLAKSAFFRGGRWLLDSEFRPTCCEHEDCEKQLRVGFTHTCRACKGVFCSRPTCCKRGPKGSWKVQTCGHEVVVTDPKFLCTYCDDQKEKVSPGSI